MPDPSRSTGAEPSAEVVGTIVNELRAAVTALGWVVNELRAAVTALGWVETAFRTIDEGRPGSPPHCSAADAKRAYDRGMNALREYDALTGRCCGRGEAPCPTHYAAIDAPAIHARHSAERNEGQRWIG